MIQVLGTIEAMRNSQGTTLLFLAVALVLFFFSLALLPAVEDYCRFRKPAIVLLILQIPFVIVRLRISANQSESALKTAAIVFSILGIILNAVLLITAQGKC
jgi:hypothetical protein